MSYRRAVALGLAASLAGCSTAPKPAQTATEKIPLVWREAFADTLLPASKGSQWVYSVEALDAFARTTASTSVTYRVDEVSKTSGSTTAKISVHGPDGVLDRATWRISPNGIDQTTGEASNLPFEPPLPIVKFPLKDGETWTYSGKGPRPTGGAGPFTQSFRAVGAEEVDTGVGRKQAFAIESTSKWTADGKNFRAEYKSWWAPDTGLVRSFQRVVAPNTAASQRMWLETDSPTE